ncbi:MAG: pseudouridine-5'-phosphate glycosidase [Spirochaetales bacterium]|jgi:pseudouridine-5'-phosphate glycosidase|nr:pseudouridine-5'-phosphate glycosidase [Spirochaetales bacterium]HOI22045.1 pseudouridine-5'-phosphate glycosidase [Spirochaetales bacterium]
MNKYLSVAEEVAAALGANKPVIALESTIISHGMPWPKNLETALAVEELIRSCGAVPATVALMEGRLCAGLSRAQLEVLARAGSAVTKASRRDFPRLLASGGTGATTVAGTMIVAFLAGIRIFATGGMGGVHRGAESSWDVSADLEELSRTSVCVVCAGAKSILDLPKTLEYLETKGVPVIGYKTRELPAFYTSRSGLELEEMVESPGEAAALLHAKWAAGLEGGVVIANPIPERYEMKAEVIEPLIQQAIAEAQSRGIAGKRLTPFLLDKIVEISGGDSLESNIALVKNNARLAAAVASAYSGIMEKAGTKQ